MNTIEEGKRLVTIHDVEREEEVIELDPNKPTVYLCGGFYGEWNDYVKNALEGRANIIDPRDFERTPNESYYVSRDIDAIENSDILFAYRQKENPGIGMAHEIGYGASNGQIVIFAGDYNDDNDQRYWAFARELADYSCINLEEAVLRLVLMVNHYYEEQANNGTGIENFGGIEGNDSGMYSLSSFNDQYRQEFNNEEIDGPPESDESSVPTLEQAG